MHCLNNDKDEALLLHSKASGGILPTSTFDTSAPEAHPSFYDLRRSISRNDAAMARGPHKSAYEFQEFLREEMLDFVCKAFWMVLPYDRVKEIEGLVKRLRISPLGVVPQHDRRPHIIVDYSFWGLNDETLKLSHQEAMQFGRALERIIAKVVLADPRYGPVKVIKIDIADGFYRIRVRTEDIPKLGVIFPHKEGEAPLVAFPLVLPMGWTESPPYFCAATETVTDIANDRMAKWRNPPIHRLEADTQVDVTGEELPPVISSSPELGALEVPTDLDPLLACRRARQLAYIDVFVDDFLGAAQGNEARLNRVRRILMDSIDLIFRPLEAGDSPTRLEPISVKKLRQGDATWSTCKKLLGWIIDSVAMTLTLPPRRLARLAEILAEIPRSQKRLSIKKWHRLLGELRSMSIAIPGARGLFSQLQVAGRTEEQGRIRLHRGFHDTLDDFRWLQRDLEHRPTRLYELVPMSPTLVGSHDASGLGAGGVWLPGPTAVSRATPLLQATDTHLDSTTTASNVPVVWRLPFSQSIRNKLVTHTNREGVITNSDLELGGGVMHDEAAVQCFDVRKRTIKSGTDNLATLFWNRKGSVTANSATSRLLRVRAIHQRYHCYVPLKDYIPGPVNSMADNASRLFQLSDFKFLT
jgi:hypothetical protein